MKRFKSHSEDHGTEVLRFDFIRAAIRVHRKVFTRKDSRVSVIRAFTLLELLIVISIIAILAATIVPNFIGFDMEARLSATKTNLITLQTRVSIFRAKEGRYPERL